MHAASPPTSLNASLRMPVTDLSAHQGSAQVFHESCLGEMDLRDHLSQWTEWVDSLLARRFATTLLLVGSLAGVIALLV